MKEMENEAKRSELLLKRTNELYVVASDRLHKSTDRMFLVLMVIQWIAGVLCAYFLSPLTWAGSSYQMHDHLYAAIFLGGLISAMPIAMTVFAPGSLMTRHVIAIAQMSWSGLLIHLAGGRIETHFHVFGSLAFLSFYRDWRVILTATVITAADHAFRGIFWPGSLYGVITASPFRWLEHAAWVIFEDIFLVISCRRSLRDLHSMCERRASLEQTNADIERIVELRTQQLREAKETLNQEFLKHKDTQAEREKLFSDLAAASRQAGMAEVATGVLHNVGNILNSVNVSVQTISDRLTGKQANSIHKVCQLLDAESSNIGQFMESDPRGQKLPLFLKRTAESMTQEESELKNELGVLTKNVDHIKQTIAMQQSMAKTASANEPVNLKELIDDSIAINASSFSRHDVEVELDIDTVPEITVDKHKVMQILVNLIKNSKQATKGCKDERHKRVKVSLKLQEPNNVQVSVADNGVGIAPENMPKMFTHGFTTKKDGHGFGLHSAAIDANSMGGSLTVESDGIGKGATFTLTLPLIDSEGTKGNNAKATASSEARESAHASEASIGLPLEGDSASSTPVPPVTS